MRKISKTLYGIIATRNTKKTAMFGENIIKLVIYIRKKLMKLSLKCSPLIEAINSKNRKVTCF